MPNFFPHIDLEYYVFLDLTKNSKSDVDERGHRLRFFPHASVAGNNKILFVCLIKLTAGSFRIIEVTGHVFN